MNKSLLIIIILVILVVVGFVLLSTDEEVATDTQNFNEENAQRQTRTTQNEATSTQEDATATSSPESEAVERAAVVTYTENGFSPKTVKINEGETVEFVNESSGEMWIGSDVHPTHTEYNGTTLREHCQDGSGEAFDQCGTGQSYSFTFDKTGEWGYHNHVRAANSGVVIVE